MVLLRADVSKPIPKAEPTASSTFSPSGTTSFPMPSPGTTAISYIFKKSPSELKVATKRDTPGRKIIVPFHRG